MTRVALLCLALLALLAGAGAGAGRAPAAKAQLPCGLPDRQPLWVDFADGSVPFWSTVFARPGIVAGAANFIVPPQLRAGGAKTIYFDLNFHVRMGSPSAPVDSASVTDRADRLFDTAAQSSGCDHPLIALNELFGAQTPTPWTPTTAQYRANVLAFVQRLAARGARPFLLLSNRPYTHGEAGDWWLEVARYADLVPEVYFSGPSVWKQGVSKGSLRLRSTLRTRIADLAEIGVPATRIGVMLDLQLHAEGRRARGARAAVALARRREVGGARREGRRARHRDRQRLVVGVGTWTWPETTRTSRSRPASGCGRETRRSATRPARPRGRASTSRLPSAVRFRPVPCACSARRRCGVRSSRR